MLPHLGDDALGPVQRPGVAVGAQEEGVGVLRRHAPGLQQRRVHGLRLAQPPPPAVRVDEQVVADHVRAEGAPVHDPLADLMRHSLRNHTVEMSSIRASTEETERGVRGFGGTY